MADIKKTTKTVVTLKLSEDEALAVGAALRGFNEARSYMVQDSDGQSVHLKAKYKALVDSVGETLRVATTHEARESVWAYRREPEATPDPS